MVTAYIMGETLNLFHFFGCEFCHGDEVLLFFFFLVFSDVVDGDPGEKQDEGEECEHVFHIFSQSIAPGTVWAWESDGDFELDGVGWDCHLGGEVVAVGEL